MSTTTSLSREEVLAEFKNFYTVGLAWDDDEEEEDQFDLETLEEEEEPYQLYTIQEEKEEEEENTENIPLVVQIEEPTFEEDWDPFANEEDKYLSIVDLHHKYKVKYSSVHRKFKGWTSGPMGRPLTVQTRMFQPPLYTHIIPILEQDENVEDDEGLDSDSFLSLLSASTSTSSSSSTFHVEQEENLKVSYTPTTSSILPLVQEGDAESHKLTSTSTTSSSSTRLPPIPTMPITVSSPSSSVFLLNVNAEKPRTSTVATIKRGLHNQLPRRPRSFLSTFYSMLFS